MHVQKENQNRLEVGACERRDSITSSSSEPVQSRVKVNTCKKQRRFSLPAEISLPLESPSLREVVYQPVLKGNNISSFYNLWRRSKPNRPLGRGKLELPNSMKLEDKYRQCGCVSRTHSRTCKSNVCCSSR